MATKMNKTGKYFITCYFNLITLIWIQLDLLYALFSVAECKVLYKRMHDALRYRRTKIGEKSIDSGDELKNDDVINDDWEFKDSLAFLTPTRQDILAKQ